MSFVDLVRCEGSACPIKHKCLRYAPNKHTHERPFKFFASPPFKRDACEHFLEVPNVQGL
jgi:hypothetical protein